MTTQSPCGADGLEHAATESAAAESTALGPSRRTMLCGLVTALLAPAALAAACGGDSGGVDGGAGGGGGTGAGAATPGGTGGATAGGGTALAKLADVPVGGGVIVNTPQGLALLVQPTAGTVKAFSAVCTHQGTTIGTPQAGVSTCPNHGSQFNVADGSVKRGPAASPLPAVPVKIQGTDVVLA